jgi:FtsH-binding integral membrane protein
MMTSCPECGRAVSDQATSCPGCGLPFAAVTIQATARQWKALLLLGFLVFFGGMVLAGLADERFTHAFGEFLVIASFVMIVVSRIGAWWQNE